MTNDLKEASRLAGEISQLTEGKAKLENQILAHRVQGSTKFNLGQFDRARERSRSRIGFPD